MEAESLFASCSGRALFRQGPTFRRAGAPSRGRKGSRFQSCQDSRRLFQIPPQDWHRRSSGGASGGLQAKESFDERALRGRQSLSSSERDETVSGVTELNKPIVNMAASIRERYLENARIPIQLDLGFGDVVTPRRGE